MLKRGIALVALTVMLLLQLALPALAYGIDQGNVNCPANNIAVRHRTYGQTSIQVPSGSTVDTRNYATYTTSTTWTYQSGYKSWKVFSPEGGVDAPATYAFCWGT